MLSLSLLLYIAIRKNKGYDVIRVTLLEVGPPYVTLRMLKNDDITSVAMK